MPNNLTPLPVAVRVFPVIESSGEADRKNKKWRLPNAMFVFDTETRTDAAQRLTFGSYRFFVNGELKQEGLFYADDLPDKDRKTLERYVADQRKRAQKSREVPLLLLTRRDFLKKFYKAVYKGRALLVGFNLPFDLSRIAFGKVGARTVRRWLLARALVIHPERGRKTGQSSARCWYQAHRLQTRVEGVHFALPTGRLRPDSRRFTDG